MDPRGERERRRKTVAAPRPPAQPPISAAGAPRSGGAPDEVLPRDDDRADEALAPELVAEAGADAGEPGRGQRAVGIGRGGGEELAEERVGERLAGEQLDHVAAAELADAEGDVE